MYGQSHLSERKKLDELGIHGVWGSNVQMWPMKNFSTDKLGLPAGKSGS